MAGLTKAELTFADLDQSQLDQLRHAEALLNHDGSMGNTEVILLAFSKPND